MLNDFISIQYKYGKGWFNQWRNVTIAQSIHQKQFACLFLVFYIFDIIIAIASIVGIFTFIITTKYFIILFYFNSNYYYGVMLFQRS